MKILTICANLERGGTQRAAQSYSQAYFRAGQEVVVWGFQPGGVRAAQLRESGIRVLESPAAIADADAFGPDVIHIHRAGFAEQWWTDLLRQLRRPNRCIIETNVFSRVDYSHARDLIDVHMHLSKWCLWKWQKWLGSRRSVEAGVVVPYPVDGEQFHRCDAERRNAFRRRLGIPERAFVCGRVGQPQPAKWHERNVLSFVALAKSDSTAHLVVRGTPPNLSSLIAGLPQEVRSRIHELPLTDSDDELMEMYSSIDCFLHGAQIGESFGMVLAEAMLCGCPVVTASRPHKDNSQLEVVGHRRGGLVAGSLSMLDEALHQFRYDEALRRQLEPDLRKWILDRFHADHVAAVALRVARIALGAGSRAKVIQQLSDDPGLITRVSNADTSALLRDTIGGPRWNEWLAMQLVHNPSAQRVIQYVLRNWVHRSKGK